MPIHTYHLVSLKESLNLHIDDRSFFSGSRWGHSAATVSGAPQHVQSGVKWALQDWSCCVGRRASFSIRLGRVSFRVLPIWLWRFRGWQHTYSFWPSEFLMNLPECCPKRDLTSSLFGASGYNTCLPNLCRDNFDVQSLSTFTSVHSPTFDAAQSALDCQCFVPVPPRQLVGWSRRCPFWGCCLWQPTKLLRIQVENLEGLYINYWSNTYFPTYMCFLGEV